MKIQLDAEERVAEGNNTGRITGRPVEITFEENGPWVRIILEGRIYDVSRFDFYRVASAMTSRDRA